MRRHRSEEDWQIEMITPTGDKVARTHAIQSAFAAGLIYAPETEWAENAIDQSGVFPKSKHDDVDDSMTQAIAWRRIRAAAHRCHGSGHDDFWRTSNGLVRRHSDPTDRTIDRRDLSEPPHTAAAPI
jgi:hypothetical protein